MSKNCIFLIIFNCVLCTTLNFNDNQYAIKNGEGFIFLMPRVLESGRNHSVCLSLHEISPPTRNIIEIKLRDRHVYLTKIMETEHSCFEIFIPKSSLKDPSLVNVKVQIQSGGSIYSAHNLDPVLLYPTKWFKIFLDTDRGVYRPGDKIKFRVLVVDEQLMPVNMKVPKISIKNPFDIAVAVWEDVTLENGLVSLEYEIVKEALVGKWKLETGANVKIFEVSKYVLPRFKVELLIPNRIYINVKSFEIKICAHYSHGRNVKGYAFIKVTDSEGHMRPVNRLERMENGCRGFTLTSEDLFLTRKLSSVENKMYLHITGTVTEKGTNKIEIVFGKIVLDFQPFVMKFSSESMFQPGLLYNGKLSFNNVNVNLSQELVQICYNIAIKKSWNYVNDEQCSNFTLNEDNELNFQVLPMTRNVIHMNFYAKSLNHTSIEDSFLVVRLFSPSNSYIQIEQIIAKKEEGECRPPQQFKITFTTDQFEEDEKVTIFYMFKSGSQIIMLNKVDHVVKKTIPDYIHDLKNIIGQRHKYTKLGTYIDDLTITFKLNKRFISNYQLLVYYSNKNGETIAASKEIKVDLCLMKVKANWTQQQMVPGSTAQLNIETNSQSLCSVSVVDKSSRFLTPNYERNKLETLIKLFTPEDRNFLNSTRKNCVARDRNHKQGHKSWSLKRSQRHIYSFAEDYDAFDIFNNFGGLIITNLKTVSKSCYQGPTLKNTKKVQFLTQKYENGNEDQVTSIRSHFPETWLWELIPVSGAIQLKRHLPHSITSYVTNVLCVSETEGVGLSNETEITSFQSFFVEVLTPYNVKREETFNMYIHLSNYRSHSIPINIKLRMSLGLELDEDNSQPSISYCIAANDTITHRFKLKAVALGTENVSVLAETDNQYPLPCGPETVLFKRDSEIKSIIVEAEGFKMRKTKSALLCTSGNLHTNNVSWDLSIPPFIISGTYKSHIALNGDILGKTIENLDQLLDIPTGCGEQIMATMAPNLYVLRYLNATNSLSKSMKQGIIRNLKIGYQRILNYIHNDGSFSAFGYHDPMGSMFLTTFVVKILTQAKQYIHIDHNVLEKAVLWIFSHQLENGCFNTMLHVFQDMGGTSQENSTATLTSYVISSLLEANIDIPETVISNAKFCIKSQINPDKYSLALNCYAMFQMNWKSEATKLLRKLLAVSEQHQNMMWWNNKGINNSISSDIETTSYALLALLHQNSTETWASALSVVRWLSSKYSSTGSFISTQDTVVALDALARYLYLVESHNLNLIMYVQTPDGKFNLTLTETDSLMSRRIITRATNGTVSIKISGSGCVLAQVIQTFNLRNVPRSEAFKFAIETSPVSTIDQCAITSLSPCLAYVAPDGPSNMAVMEISLPSGYQADRSSLYKLIEYRNISRIEMFEEKEDKVNLYFTKLDNHQICFTFNINENFLIEGRKNSLIKLYDYYNPDHEIQQYYNLSEECKKYDFNSEIPEIIETVTGSSTSTPEISTENSSLSTIDINEIEG